MADDVTDRVFLLEALARFIREACTVPGVLRVAVIGSLTTDKTSPKGADVLVTVQDDVEIKTLAALGRKLQGGAQKRNRGADIFLANPRNAYIGRACGYRECHPRRSCSGASCYLGRWIRDDFHVLRLPERLIAEPPLEVWPRVVVRVQLPSDTRAILLGEDGQQGAAHSER